MRCTFVSPSKRTLTPFCISQNNMNLSSRHQQDRVYHRENAKDFLSKEGPGPGYYQYEIVRTSMNSEKHKYSIPKVNY